MGKIIVELKSRKILRSMATVLSLVMVLMGCSTVSVTPKSEVVIGGDIPGTEHFAVEHLEIKRVADKEPNIVFSLRYDVSHSVDYGKTKQCWDEVEYYRYVSVVGFHKDYSFQKDGQELFMGAFWAIMSPAVLLNVVLDLGSTWDDVFEIYGHLPVAILPGVVGFDDISNGVKVRCIKRRNATSEDLPPSRQRTVQYDFPGSLSVDVLTANGKLLGNVSLSGDQHHNQSIRVPTEKVLQALTDSAKEEKLVLSVASNGAEIIGQHKFEFAYDPIELIDRYIASVDRNSIPEAIPAFSRKTFVVKDITLGNEDGKIKAGEMGFLEVEICTQGDGDCYRIKPAAKAVSGDVEFEAADEILLLKAGKTKVAKIPFYLPLTAKDGEAALELCAEDAFGRNADPITVTIPYSHRELPELQIASYQLNACPDAANTYDLEITLRNRGKGDAEHVVMAVNGEPSIGTLVRQRDTIDLIEPYSRKTAKLQIRIPKGFDAENLKIKLVVSERFGGSRVDRELVIPIIAN